MSNDHRHTKTAWVILVTVVVIVGNHKVVAITVILRNRRNTEVPGILFSED